MKYTQEMMLQSDSGYCMPFEEKGKDVEMSLGYGKQKHPKTGETFFHHGVDFPVKHYLLSDLAMMPFTVSIRLSDMASTR